MQRDGFSGEWRRLHNSEFHVLCTSKNVISVIKSNQLWWAGYVICMVQREEYTEFWQADWKVSDLQVDQGEDGKIIVNGTWRSWYIKIQIGDF